MQLPRVLEGRAVPAHTAVAEGERVVLDDELVRDQLFAGPLMSGDNAGDGLIAVVTITDADAHEIADSQTLPSPYVVDLDIDRSHRDKLAVLPCPREVDHRVSP